MERASCYYQPFALMAFRSPIKSFFPCELCPSCLCVCVCAKQCLLRWKCWRSIQFWVILRSFWPSVSQTSLLLSSRWGIENYLFLPNITSSPVAKTGTLHSSIGSWRQPEPIVRRVRFQSGVAKIDLHAKIESIIQASRGASISPEVPAMSTLVASLDI